MVEIKEVLERVNKFRIAMGMEPLVDLPKGIRYRVNACPIAQTMPTGWHIGNYVLMAPMTGISKEIFSIVVNNWGPIDESLIKEEEDLFINPDIIQQFISEFDRGRWPQYLSNEEIQDDGSVI